MSDTRLQILVELKLLNLNASLKHVYLKVNPCVVLLTNLSHHGYFTLI